MDLMIYFRNRSCDTFNAHVLLTSSHRLQAGPRGEAVGYFNYSGDMHVYIFGNVLTAQFTGNTSMVL